MPLPVMLAAAVALFLLAVMAVRVWAHRSRAQPETVTEAAARAHPSPLTRSVLSVGPQPRPRGPSGADT
jgi:hypothetical protein